jgi:hypothetical protein
MPNLYTDDLSRVSAEDVAQFLCLDSSDPKARPAEGVRFDFKRDLPQDLGDTVAAFSNTYGGLILLGVDSFPGQKNVPGSLPGASLGNDPKARVTDKILATVHPRPNFEVHVTLAQGPGKCVAVIRVREGTFPPYEFSQGATIKIPVRIEDSDRQASVRDVENLFRRREEQGRLSEKEVAPYLFPLVGSLTIPSFERPSQRVADVFRFAMVLIPTGRLRLQLDLNSERHFESLIRSAFKGDREFSRAKGGARWQEDWHRLGGQSDYEFRIDEGPPCDRIWRFWSDGALGFATNHSRSREPESVGNLVSDTLRFCQVATKLFEERGYFGDLLFAQNLQCPSRKFEASFPIPGIFGGYDEVDGIKFPAPILRAGSTESTYLLPTDWDTVQNPTNLVVSAMVYLFREIASASVDSEKLRQHAGSHLTYLKSSVWAKP